MVSFPQALSASPSAVMNHRSASQRARHRACVSSAASRLCRVLARRAPPRQTATCPRSSRRSTAAARARSRWRRCCFSHRSAWVAYPRVRPRLPPTGTARRASIRRVLAPSDARSARRFRPASAHRSSVARVIAPAHRELDSAVSPRFRSRRDAARPAPSSRPSVSVRQGRRTPEPPDVRPRPPVREHLRRMSVPACGLLPRQERRPRTGP